jgi:uncharacterized membrane protein YgcG
VAGGSEDDVDGVASGAGEEVVVEMAVRLHVADHRLDGGAPPDLPSDGRRDAALLFGPERADAVCSSPPSTPLRPFSLSRVSVGPGQDHSGPTQRCGPSWGCRRVPAMRICGASPPRRLRQRLSRERGSVSPARRPRAAASAEPQLCSQALGRAAGKPVVGECRDCRAPVPHGLNRAGDRSAGRGDGGGLGGRSGSASLGVSSRSYSSGGSGGSSHGLI